MKGMSAVESSVKILKVRVKIDSEIDKTGGTKREDPSRSSK